MTRKEQLERSIIYTPRTREELDGAINALEYARSVGDVNFFPVYICQIQQGNEYLTLTGQK